MTEIRFHGRGGQGIVTLSELIARASVIAGKYAQTMPFFGVERRGAAVKASVRISDEPIKARSQSVCPDILVLLNKNLMSFAMNGGADCKAVLVVNSASPLPCRLTQWYFDAEAAAFKNGLVSGGEPFINVPIFGVLCFILGYPVELAKEAVRYQWGGDAAALNAAAAAEAYGSVKYLKGGAAFEG